MSGHAHAHALALALALALGGRDHHGFPAMLLPINGISIRSMGPEPTIQSPWSSEHHQKFISALVLCFRSGFDWPILQPDEPPWPLEKKGLLRGRDTGRGNGHPLIQPYYYLLVIGRQVDWLKLMLDPLSISPYKLPPSLLVIDKHLSSGSLARLLEGRRASFVKLYYCRVPNRKFGRRQTSKLTGWNHTSDP
jgi:hypothetical protein